MQPFKGFTLVELVIVLAIIAILAVISAPSFRALTLDNRLSATSNNILGALQMARSEAVTQRSSIKICAANTTNTACANAKNWSAGILIVKGTSVLKIINSANTGVTATASANEIIYKGDGTTTASTVTIADDRGNGSALTIKINLIGQACSGSSCS